MLFVYLAFATLLLGMVLSVNRPLSFGLASFSSLLMFIGGISCLFHPASSPQYYLMPGLSIGIGVDHTTAIFLVATSIAFFAISFYSKDFGRLFSWKMTAFHNLTVFGMLLVMTAQDSINFLIGWELMTIALYFQILERKGSYESAFSFLAFGELSAISLFLAFASLFVTNGSFTLTGNVAANPFFLVMATLGFIVKMDAVPFHTWITGAYSKAPSNTAAMLSAPLTFMGFYGLVRILSFTGYPKWWGIIVLVFGAISAFWGGMQAAAERSLKKLPAYSTVENNGIILAALGLSAIAATYGTPETQTLSQFALLASMIVAFAHLISKSLLFESVGHAKESLQEEEIDNVRGIWRNVGSVPALGLLTSGLSFSAFPPTIGFVGEWMVLEAMFQSYKLTTNVDRLLAAFAGIMVALAIGLAGFAMVKLVGYTALGPDHGRETRKMKSGSIKLSQIFLILLIVLSGIFAPLIVRFLGYNQFLTGVLGVPNPLLIASSNPIFGVVSPTMFFVVVGVILIPLVIIFLTRRTHRKVESWNGGMSLTEDEYFTVPAYSFVLEYVLRKVYRTKELRNGYSAGVVNKDIAEYIYEYADKGVRSTSRFVGRNIMSGKISWYVLYIVIVFILAFILA